jgi:hypothetical protein
MQRELECACYFPLTQVNRDSATKRTDAGDLTVDEAQELWKIGSYLCWPAMEGITSVGRTFIDLSFHAQIREENSSHR